MRGPRVKTRCVFRIAAGPRVGYGHMMRASALARCLPFDVAVSVRGGGEAVRRARAIGPVVGDDEALRLADVVIVDDPSEAHGRRWIARARRKGVFTVSVQDDARTSEADIVVASGLDAPRPAVGAALLYGPRFYLLDRSTGRRSAPRQSERQRVLIAVGGGHHVQYVAQPLVDAVLERSPEAEIMVAAGFSADRPFLRGASWLEAPSGLTPALRRADVAVVAGGVTLYEACALGVPAVGVAVVAAQQRAITAFASRDAVIDAGLFSSRSMTADVAGSAVARLLRSRALRQRMSARAMTIVDGKGARRVSSAITSLMRVEAGRA